MKSMTEVARTGNTAYSPVSKARGFTPFAVKALLPQTSLMAICGSYPPDPPNPSPQYDNLAEIIALGMRSNERVIVDGKGPIFEWAINRSMPRWCIKPNLEEAAQLLRRSIRGPHEELRAVRDMVHFGIAVVLLSCGERGAYLGLTGDVFYFCPAPRVHEVSPVGSGDALVGAFAAHYLATGDILEAVRWGVAAGAANAAQLRPAFCTRANIEALLP